MVVGKLRMKDTEADPRSNPLYKHRKTRHRTRSPSIDPPPEPYGPGRNDLDQLPSGSSSFSRALNKGKSKQVHDSSGFKANDELVIQWTTTSSNLANQLLSIPSSIKSTREFESKLKEALIVENDDLRLESLLNDEFYLPHRWKNHVGLKHSKADLNGHQLSQLESEEYEEYIRKRMWSQSNKKHYLTSKYQEEQQRKGIERAQEKSRKCKIDAKRRAEREAFKNLKLRLKQQQRCRDRYFGRWEILNSLINSEVVGLDRRETEIEAESRKKSDLSIRQVIEFEEIPWPVYTSNDGIESDLLSQGGIEQLNRSAIHDFLVGHLVNDTDDNSAASKQAQRKKIIRNAILSYHPDRFNRLLNRIKDVNNSAQKAQEWGLRVSQILNELNQSIDLT